MLIDGRHKAVIIDVPNEKEYKVRFDRDPDEGKKKDPTAKKFVREQLVQEGRVTARTRPST